MRLLQSFGLAIPLTYHVKTLIFTVLYGHRFFYIPFVLPFHVQCVGEVFSENTCFCFFGNVKIFYPFYCGKLHIRLFIRKIKPENTSVIARLMNYGSQVLVGLRPEIGQAVLRRGNARPARINGGTVGFSHGIAHYRESVEEKVISAYMLQTETKLGITI